MTTFLLEREDFPALLKTLTDAGYQVIAPTVREGAIVYDEIESIAELPIGYHDEQEAAFYRLHPTKDKALFSYVVGPQSWKRFLHPPEVRLWQAKRVEGGMEIVPNTQAVPRYAFVGVRACELHAIAIQDKIFMQGEFVDPIYQARREAALIVAVNCGVAGGTCFCASMHTGPQVTSGFDLALTEVLEDGRHYFVVEVGSDTGKELWKDVPHRKAKPEEAAAAQHIIEHTAAHMGRELDIDGLPEIITRKIESPRWETIAQTCLACANCTMVCPTCFCNTIEDVTDLTGGSAERIRKWDSCFTMDFSYIHGGSVRYSTKARYRQWLTHKLATWVEQFGTLGCVGCGRCITWCPVAIDITAEAAAIRQSDDGKGK
ncbi:MAG: 4Fe-4S dicluster domain-containing protein [Anaerolineales bacterium]|nr:4Fe-4S dicluster domain-containing protein [Anaerolineales bacterium]